MFITFYIIQRTKLNENTRNIKMKWINLYNKIFYWFFYFDMNRVAIGSDRKQFVSSDPTKNKNESDPIRQKKSKTPSDPIRFNSIRQYGNLIWFKRIGFSKKFAFASAIGSESSHKTVSVDAKPTDFRRTSDPTRPP